MAAGHGHRMGRPIPKQYLNLNGTPILVQALLAFLTHPAIDAVCVVIAQPDEDFYREAIAQIPSVSLRKLLPPVLGGAERADSVRQGLENLAPLSPQRVLIHDGARPFITQSLIGQVIQALADHKGVIPGIAVADTLKRVSNGLIQTTIDRRDLYHAQTPQGFDYATILAAHQESKNHQNITDDACLLEHLEIPVHLISGDPQNKKITTPEDMKDPQMPLPYPDVRVGHGIDVHALSPGNGIVLCGIFIPAPFSLIGHSDADLGFHSLTDALLGTIGDGDIGQHFSPKDDQWKGADSAVFLKDAARRVREKGGFISHVDITVLGERPKVAPYRDQMIAKIAEVLESDPTRVSVKATTTEKLGFIGREEGMGAFATATVVFQ
jgi:2-C-methyl-D-erythritol 4-phosphate cytidylyltransferase/2-C-methyl-D-erythritol 2,4-cyclodiphosphate synthase